MLGYLFIGAWHQSSCEALIYRLPPALFNLSLTASIVILAVLVARFFLRKAPRVISYALWAVVAFRLICPVSFSSSFSLLGAMDAPVAETGQIEYVPVDIVHNPYPSVDLIIPEVTEVVNEQLPSHESQIYGEFLEAPAELSTWIWLIGIGVMLLCALSSYLNLRYKLRTAVLLEGNVFQSEHVGSPFILGLFRPKIYIPFGLDESTLRYVLAHERYHLKRLDHIVKVLAFAILVIHWFNPLCWLAFNLMSKDMEMSCDEKVLSQDNSVKTEYSTVLLSFAANRRFPSPSPLAFGETSTKSRIKNTLKWKRPKVWVTVLAAVLCTAVIAACAANPTQESSTNAETGTPYDWTNTVKASDIQNSTVAIHVDGVGHSYDLLDGQALNELTDILNQIPADSIYAGRETSSQMDMNFTCGDEYYTLSYGGESVEFHSSLLLGTGIIWEIHDDALNEFMAQWLEKAQNTYTERTEAKSENKTENTGVAWKYNPILSSVYPAFPFRFNFPYTHIRATCTNGSLAVYESNGENYGHRQSLQFTSGQAIYWEPSSSQTVYQNPVLEPLVSPSTTITFTIYDDQEILYTGNLQVSQIESDSINGSYLYSASLTNCNELVLKQADDYLGGGWVSQPSGVHPITSE